MNFPSDLPLGWGWAPTSLPNPDRYRQPDVDRNTRILSLHRDGMTMDRIGLIMGISGARVHQIITDARRKATREACHV